MMNLGSGGGFLKIECYWYEFVGLVAFYKLSAKEELGQDRTGLFSQRDKKKKAQEFQNLQGLQIQHNSTFPSLIGKWNNKTKNVLSNFSEKSERMITIPFVLNQCMLSCSVMSNSLWPFGLQPARLLCPWDFLGKNTGEGCHFPPPGDLPDPGMEPKSPVSPTLQVDSVPAEPTQI